MSTPSATFRHPRGLYLLFATEMWERLSYYGMRALLVLYMTDRTRGGLGFDDEAALRIYGLYTGSVYLTTLAGGALADRVLGQRRAVLLGGGLMVAGHLALAVPGLVPFVSGLVLLVLGSGLFKPNISSLVGGLYAEGDARREGGFTFFYMGINLGALLGPWIVGTLGERVGWHVGFGSAGLGLIVGLVAYAVLAPRFLGAVGAEPPGRTTREHPSHPLTREERDRLLILITITAFAVLFWAAFEQAGGLVNLFTERSVDRHVAGWLVPASWFQSAEPGLILLLGPAFAGLWVRLAKRPDGGPTAPMKVAAGLLTMGLGLVPLLIAARGAESGRVSLAWILAYYLLSTIGELSLSPVALSAVTRLAPPRLVSLMMGVWFISLAGGNYLGGYLGSLGKRVGIFPLYAGLCGGLILSAALLVALSPKLKRMAHGAERFHAST